MKLPNTARWVVTGLVVLQVGVFLQAGAHAVEPLVQQVPTLALQADSSEGAQKKASGKTSGQPPAAPETDSGAAGGSGARPLKPFTPSEKIKADQEVDFPYDI